MEKGLGPCATISDFEASLLTPGLERYVNDEHSIDGNNDEVTEFLATPELNYQYLNIDLVLPRGGEEVRG